MKRNIVDEYIIETEDHEMLSKLEIYKYIPKAFGYNIEGSANAGLPIASVGGKAGLNYVVYTQGKHSWFPYQYYYAGYSVNLILQKNLQNTLKEVKGKGVKGLIKGSADLSGAISLFLAWTKDITEKDPTDWEKWFVEVMFSVQAKAGLGLSAGASGFAGADDPSEKLLDKTVQDLYAKNKWFGASIDVGVGAGTPSVTFTDYSSYFWLMDGKEPVTLYSNPKLFLERWWFFIRIKTDIVAVLEKVGIKIPHWLKKIIRGIQTYTPSLLVNQGKTYMDYGTLSEVEKEIVISEYIAMAEKEYIFEEYTEYLANNNIDSHENMA